MKRLLVCLTAVLVFALGARGEDIQALMRQLKSRDAGDRRQAAKTLAEAGPEAKPAIAELTAALRDSDKFVRRFAAQALGAQGANARSAVNPLRNCLNDDKKEVVEAAIDALVKIGNAGLPPLIEYVKNPKEDPELKRKIFDSVAAVDNIDPKLSSQIYVHMLGDNDRDFRNEVVAALRKLGPEKGKAAVPYLNEALRDKNQTVREEAARALSAYGVSGKAAVPNLIYLLDDKNRRVREQAVRALGAVGPEAKDALPTLRLIADATKEDANVKRAAEEAIKRIDMPMPKKDTKPESPRKP